MNDCKHEQFQSVIFVNRLPAYGKFQADIKIHCGQCGQPFQFVGLPPGLNLDGAAMSVDGTEARLAIVPPGEIKSPLQEGIEALTPPEDKTVH